MAARRSVRCTAALAAMLATAPIAPAIAQPRDPAASGPTQAAAAQPAAATPAGAAQDDRWWSPYLEVHDWLRDRGIHPLAGVVVSGSGLAFGARYRRPRLLGGPIGAEISGMWSVRGYDEYRLRAGLIQRLDDTLTLRPADAKVSSQFNDFEDRLPGAAVYLDLQWRDYPRVNFYGIGADASLERRSDFALRGYSADLVGQWEGQSGIGLAARAGVLAFDIGRGANDAVPDLQDAFDPARVPGATDQPAFVTLGLSGVIDARNAPDMPSSGTFVGVSAWWFEPIDREDPDVVRIAADARGYFTPFDVEDVVAVRALLSSELGGDPTPFYLHYHLGGSETLRGYPSYLFRDAALLQMSAEYRWRVGRYVEIAPFVDVGVTGANLGALRSGQLEVTPGIGLRGRYDDRIVGRLDIGYRPGAVRFAFSMGPAF